MSNLIPKDANGETPNAITLRNWITKNDWITRANSLDIEISQQTDRELVKVRIDMMKRHAEQARVIAETAYNYLIDSEGGFDSSAAAVNAWVKAVEEEKKSTGLATSLSRVYSLSDDDLKKQLDQLIGRLSNVGEVTISSPDEEIEDAASSEETPNE